MALDCRPPSPLFVIMLIDFSARVLLVGLKAPLDRLRPDDSILAAIRIFERKRRVRARKCRFRNQSSYLRLSKAVISHDRRRAVISVE